MLPKSAYKKNRPPWLRVKYVNNSGNKKISDAVKSNGLNTVCQTANCPNIFECYDNSSLTFLILGDKCSRSCSFCRVKSASSLSLDLDEPRRVAKAVTDLALKRVVITSVTRDDILDGGASLISLTISMTKENNPDCHIEALIPDLRGRRASFSIIFKSEPDILAHNIETVRRLYPKLRPQGDYDRSLKVLQLSKQAGLLTKSGMMVGLGEERDEIIEAMKDAHSSGTDIFTIGQYLSPSPIHHPISRYYQPSEFRELRSIGFDIGFSDVMSGPLTRSSYNLGGK